MFYQTHIFCCTNRRADDHRRGSCAGKGAEDLRAYMKERAKALGLEKTRVNAAGCLDRCELGPVIVVYPQGAWFSAKTRADIDAILERHVLKGEELAHLRLLDNQVKPAKDS